MDREGGDEERSGRLFDVPGEDRGEEEEVEFRRGEILPPEKGTKGGLFTYSGTPHEGLRRGRLAMIRKYGAAVARRLCTDLWVDDLAWDDLVKEAGE